GCQWGHSLSGAEDRAPTGHVVELHHPLRHVVRMVIRQRHDAGGELDALRSLAGRGQEHLGRADHLPPAGMVLAAPEFLVPELVQMLDEVEIAAELEHRMFPDGVMGGEERAKVQTGHEQVSWLVMISAPTLPSVPSLTPRRCQQNIPARAA